MGFFPQGDADAERVEGPRGDLHAHPLDEVAGDLGGEGAVHEVGGEEAELEEGAGVGLEGRGGRGAAVDRVDRAQVLQDVGDGPLALGVVAVLDPSSVGVASAAHDDDAWLGHSNGIRC